MTKTYFPIEMPGLTIVTVAAFGLEEKQRDITSQIEDIVIKCIAKMPTEALQKDLNDIFAGTAPENINKISMRVVERMADKHNFDRRKVTVRSIVSLNPSPTVQ